ncbi:MAG TPA: benzoate-CoA ligase family protein [Nevskiaceae bacterium]|nr:benzoate-CoA ligase family protein [Nevskiaceae bacterium]
MTQLTAPPQRFNFAQYLFDLNHHRAAKTAYIDDAGTLSYGALEEQSRRFATALLDLGIHREERVFLAMLDCREWPVAFLGCLYAGAVPICANTLLPAEEYAFMLDHSRSRAVITSATLLDKIQKAAAKTRSGTLPLVVVGATQASPSITPFADFLKREPKAQPDDTYADDIAFWMYSSGSTGRPKAVVHTHGNLYWTNETYGKNVLKLHEDDLVFSAAKFFFAYGFGNALTFPLCVGATIIAMAERPTPAAVFKRLIEHKVTIYYGVPTLFASMLAAPDKPTKQQLALRLCTSAGEPLPEQIGVHFKQQFGADILDGIGSTEMLHIFLCNRAEDIHYGTTGTPVPGYEISLRDEHGQPVPDGEIGDLYIKGPSAPLMYWRDRKRSQAAFLGEWTKAGDKYLRDAQGYYTYCGRSDDMLKVSGQYVSPAEVESTLICHDSVLEAAVIGVNNEQGLMRTKAFVVLKDGVAASPALEQELHSFVKSKLAPHKAPKQIAFIHELPKTATGKIQRFRLREQEKHGA